MNDCSCKIKWSSMMIIFIVIIHKLFLRRMSREDIIDAINKYFDQEYIDK